MKSIKIKSNFTLIIFGYCLLLAILFLLICTKSSPLYPFNDWTDANTSFSMGKTLMNGKVLYKDLFNQRGAYFYLIYGLGYLISNETFLGIFIMEVVSFSIFLYFCSKIITLYLDKSYLALVHPLLAGLVLNLNSFAHGGSPEEFALPFITCSLYYLLRYFREVYPKNIPDSWIFINGIMAGCVLWIKYSFLGFWVGWIASIMLSFVIQKEFMKALKSAALFLLGMLTATVPWLIYFGLNNGIYDWIQSYVIINITGYSQPMTLFERAKFIFYVLYEFRYRPMVVGMMGLGLFIFLTVKKYTKRPIEKISLALCYILLLITVYGGGQARKYYFVIFAPVFIFGVITLLGLYNDVYGPIKSKKVLSVIAVVLIIGTLSLVYLTNQNVYMMKIDQEDLVQYKYAEIINETENATLLNYGFLDSGFFTTTGILPSTRFAHQPNFDYSRYPEIRDEQNRYIKEAITDYVVYPIRVQDYGGEITIPNLIPHLTENYEFIRDDIQVYEGVEYRYLLFRKIN